MKKTYFLLLIGLLLPTSVLAYSRTPSGSPIDGTSISFDVNGFVGIQECGSGGIHCHYFLQPGNIPSDGGCEYTNAPTFSDVPAGDYTGLSWHLYSTNPPTCDSGGFDDSGTISDAFTVQLPLSARVTAAIVAAIESIAKSFFPAFLDIVLIVASILIVLFGIDIIKRKLK